ncbi:hypothetical protein [Aquimarina algiphila]|uniref:Uncharacterized protein n=1 Tax=Aquimarina algiphila TaxID=2047982 RepID=A0A554VRS8_9FLAO|nr:hypothetical protein [Aquimarina algiphila]TSE11328.1 hypothetical protein FOF46_01480 [Aquimarina algiphila]
MKTLLKYLTELTELQFRNITGETDPKLYDNFTREINKYGLLPFDGLSYTTQQLLIAHYYITNKNV